MSAPPEQKLHTRTCYLTVNIERFVRHPPLIRGRREKDFIVPLKPETSRQAKIATEPPARKVPKIVIASLIGAAALPPLAIDMYLPSLPEIGETFNAPASLTQWTLTIFLLTLGLGQLIAGPLSDAIGRRKPMLVGLVLFIAGSVLAAVAPSITVLLVARFLQGLGGSMAVVVANSSVRDYASGASATRLYALLMSATAIAPVIAPTIGGYLDAIFGWRGVFATLAILGVALILSVMFGLRESLPSAKRAPMAFGPTFRGFGALLTNPAFLLPAAALIAMFGLLFSYIGGSSYIYQDEFGLSPTTFGLVFGASGLALMLGSLLVNRLSRRFSTLSIGLFGHTLVLIAGAGAIVSTATDAEFSVLLTCIITILFGLGLCDPVQMGAAMSAPDRGAGQAASLLGSVQFVLVLGAGATAIAGFTAEAGTFSWTLLLAGWAVIGMILALAHWRFGATRA